MHSYLLPTAPIRTLDAYLAAGGARGLQAARLLGPDATIDEVVAAGLRGRGGAGFAVGTKWRSIRLAACEADDGGDPTRVFVVANGAEGEPATFKDRTLLRLDPYRVVEGAAIAAFAVGAYDVVLATKASYSTELANLQRAACELSAAGLLGDLQVFIVGGPDEYLFGEEKALLEVIEGREPLPRHLPPWQHGLFATTPSSGWEGATAGVDPDAASNPAVVNNVESLAQVTHILANGADWFRRHGTAATPGNLLVTIVGDVERCGVFEVPAGTTLRAVIDRQAGGVAAGRRFKAALSGVSNAVLTADDLDVPLCFDALAARGSGLGAAGFVVYDDTTDMTSVAREMARFLAVESCGQCAPCKGGAMTITEALTVIEAGAGGERELDAVARALVTVTDGNRCFLGTETQTVVTSILRAFPDDVARSVDGVAPTRRRAPVLVPLIKEITPDGRAIYDVRHAAKRPDGLYDPIDPLGPVMEVPVELTRPRRAA